MTDHVTDEQAAEEQTSADETVSHEDIAAAWDREHTKAVATEEAPVAEEKPDEDGEEPDQKGEEPGEEEKEEELSHPEKSRLGRKLKRLEDTLKDRDTRIEELKSSIDRLMGHVEAISGKEKAVEEQIDPDQILTYQDAMKLFERQKEEAQKAEQAREAKAMEYESKYKNAMLQYEDDPDYEAVSKLLTGDTPFNRIVSGDPAMDVRLNWAEAKLSLQGEKGKPKLRGEKAKGTVVGGTEKVEGTKGKGVDIGSLDQKSQEYLAYLRGRGVDPQPIVERTLGGKK